MKILWFSPTPAGYNSFSNSHNGGGWIAALEDIVRNAPDIELGIVFRLNDGKFKQEQNGVTYYPIPAMQPSMKDKLLRKDFSKAWLEMYLKVIKDFKPDLIQIFGSENDFGRICAATDIPVVIHMQGCLPPYGNALFPVGMNTYDFIFGRGLTWQRRLMGLLSQHGFDKRAKQEIATIKSCQYFMGRTQWDRAMVSLFKPTATYFHCEEALRDSFIRSGKQWMGPKDGHQTIISVISNPWYKGMDLILKTAKILKEYTDVDFEWQVYGVRDVRFFEHKYKIKAADVNVKIMGTASKDALVDALCSASVYVHPSYIDNSPNSLCEAQYLGVPVLATHVGGISSMVEDGVSGILFPANAPYDLVALIKNILASPDKCRQLGNSAKQQAIKRHSYDTILKDLLEIYHTIIDKN